MCAPRLNNAQVLVCQDCLCAEEGGRGKKRREMVTEQLSKATGCFKLHLCSLSLALALLPGHADD